MQALLEPANKHDESGGSMGELGTPQSRLVCVRMCVCPPGKGSRTTHLKHLSVCPLFPPPFCPPSLSNQQHPAAVDQPPTEFWVKMCWAGSSPEILSHLVGIAKVVEEKPQLTWGRRPLGHLLWGGGGGG